MFAIPTSITKRLPYIGPVVSTTGLILDVHEIIQNTTPVGASKVIVGRIINECTPPELLLAGKCVMLTGGIIASVATCANPLVLSGTI